MHVHVIAEWQMMPVLNACTANNKFPEVTGCGHKRLAANFLLVTNAQYKHKHNHNFCHWSYFRSDITITLKVQLFFDLSLSDHTLLLSDKYNAWPGKCPMTDCYNHLCMECMHIMRIKYSNRATALFIDRSSITCEKLPAVGCIH